MELVCGLRSVLNLTENFCTLLSLGNNRAIAIDTVSGPRNIFITNDSRSVIVHNSRSVSTEAIPSQEWIGNDASFRQSFAVTSHGMTRIPGPQRKETINENCARGRTRAEQLIRYNGVTDSQKLISQEAAVQLAEAIPVNLSQHEEQLRQSNQDGNRNELEDKACRIEAVDVVTLGNLCVDVLTTVEQLPPADTQGKWKFMQELRASPPHEGCWEGGGNSNFAIAAARIGLTCTTIGHIGPDKFGRFLRQVLIDEGITMHELEVPGSEPLGGNDYDGSTFLIWVMVDPQSRHAFCSRFDFNKNPAFSRLSVFPADTQAIIRQAKAVFCNGFVFDELPADGVLLLLKQARADGTASVFFDPGPRTSWLAHGNDELRNSLEQLLLLTDVLLLTSDEAEVLTGLSDPQQSAQQLLQKGGALKWVVVKLGPDGCVMATKDGLYKFPGFKVEVADTVGCGDSFAAAIVLGFIRGQPATTTLALANAMGAATAMRSGAGRNVATAELVKDILQSLQANQDEGNGFSGSANAPVSAKESLSSLMSIKAGDASLPPASRQVEYHEAITASLELLQLSLESRERNGESQFPRMQTPCLPNS